MLKLKLIDGLENGFGFVIVALTRILITVIFVLLGCKLKGKDNFPFPFLFNAEVLVRSCCIFLGMYFDCI